MTLWNGFRNQFPRSFGALMNYFGYSNVRFNIKEDTLHIDGRYIATHGKLLHEFFRNVGNIYITEETGRVDEQPIIITRKENSSHIACHLFHFQKSNVTTYKKIMTRAALHAFEILENLEHHDFTKKIRGSR